MRTTLVSAAVLGVVHVAVTPSAMAAGGPLAAGGSALIAATTAVPGGEGGEGGRGSTLARAGVAPFLDPPDAVRPSPLVAVGEGGEGGRGRRHWRRRGYGYYEPYRYGWGPPPPPRYYLSAALLGAAPAAAAGLRAGATAALSRDLDRPGLLMGTCNRRAHCLPTPHGRG